MVSIRRKIWYDVWQIITPPLGSGEVGTEVIIFGSFGGSASSMYKHVFLLLVCRYIYIPLGGTKNVAVCTILIFTFVALWHDLSFRLLAWGWLVSLFILPELVASYLLPTTEVYLFRVFCMEQQN